MLNFVKKERLLIFSSSMRLCNITARVNANIEISSVKEIKFKLVRREVLKHVRYINVHV